MSATGRRPSCAPPVVAIGVAAGGAGALQRLLRATVPGSAMALLVVFSAGGERRPVREITAGRLVTGPIEDGAAIAGGRVYIVGENASFAIVDGRFRLGGRFAQPDLRSPIDDVLSVLALDQDANAAGLVLGSRGVDGGFGLRAIREHGGVVCAAGDEAMPEAAEPVDFVLSPAEIPARLEAYFRRRALRFSLGAAPVLAPAEAAEIRALLSAGTGHDFSFYDEGTIAARCARRMNVLGIDDTGKFIERLRQEPREVGRLFQDLLVSVSNFFRERRAFGALARAVIQPLAGGARRKDTLTVWVPGCATGEEAYSLAILFAEQVAGAPRPRRVRLFASDVKEGALAVARRGRYPASIARDVAPIRLRRWFAPVESGWQIDETLRQSVRFCRLDLRREPPFSGLDLISCRNLLVYFSADVREQVLGMFHRLLVPGGYLFLGAPENLPREDPLFAVVDRRYRIFRRRVRVFT